MGEMITFKCNKCENDFKPENGLQIHAGTPENFRTGESGGETVNTVNRQTFTPWEEKANESPTCTALISLTKNLLYLLMSLAGLVIGLSLCGLQACLGGYMWVTGLLLDWKTHWQVSHVGHYLLHISSIAENTRV